MSHPLIAELTNEIANAAGILQQPSQADPVLLQLQKDRYHTENQMQAILRWLPTVEGKLTEIVNHYEAEIAAKDAEITALKATPTLTAVPDEYPDDAISGSDQIIGHKRPSPLHAVDNAG